MVPVAIVTQHDQIALPFEAEAFVRAVVDLPPIVMSTEIADVPGLLERQCAYPLPVRVLRYSAYGRRRRAAMACSTV